MDIGLKAADVMLAANAALGFSPLPALGEATSLQSASDQSQEAGFGV